jgi:hypothetical protein
METELTLTQSENLKPGEMGEYFFRSQHQEERRKRLKMRCWVRKVKTNPTESDKRLREFIDLPFGEYVLEYSISYKQHLYICGDCPRDMSNVIRGIEFAEELNRKESK